MERDPSKRRVKPVEPHLLQLEFDGTGSSSDDSDFKVVTDDDSGSYDMSILLDCYSSVAVHFDFNTVSECLCQCNSY